MFDAYVSIFNIMYVNTLLNTHTSDRQVTHVNKMLWVTILVLKGKGKFHPMICLCRHRREAEV